MRSFAIRDEAVENKKDLAYLVYYKQSKTFYIELPEDSDPWEVPMLLDSFVKKGQFTVDAKSSLLWVRQRIVPTDRQNLGMILKDNGLREYDEFRLLLLSMGRCEQDGYYLTELKETEIPDFLRKRFEKKVEDVVPLSEGKLLVFFKDGTCRKCLATDRLPQHFKALFMNKEVFSSVKVLPGGYGVSWGQDVVVSDRALYTAGKEVDISREDLNDYLKYRVISSAEAAETINCSKQYLHKLIQREKLHPIKQGDRYTLFQRSEIEYHAAY